MILWTVLVAVRASRRLDGLGSGGCACVRGSAQTLVGLRMAERKRRYTGIAERGSLCAWR